jgi:hypothetical protein
VAIQIRGQLRGLGLAKDIVVTTPDEFLSDKEIPGTISRAAHLEGKILYDRAA